MRDDLIFKLVTNGDVLEGDLLMDRRGVTAVAAVLIGAPIIGGTCADFYIYRITPLSECDGKTKVVTCARCCKFINALTEDYRSAVPGLGNLCVGCHGDWLEDRAEPECYSDPILSIVTFHEGDLDWHDGPGWYYTINDYPDEGSSGAFSSFADAIEHATEAFADRVHGPQTYTQQEDPEAL